MPAGPLILSLFAFSSPQDVITHECTGEWMKSAPLRVFSFDIECAGRKGHFPTPDQDSVIQIASCVSLSGSLNKPLHKAVHTLNTCNPIAGADVVSRMDEGSLFEAWLEFFVEADPDIVIGYNIINFDLPYLLDRAKALKLPNFPFLGRIKGIETEVRSRRVSSHHLLLIVCLLVLSVVLCR